MSRSVRSLLQLLLVCRLGVLAADASTGGRNGTAFAEGVLAVVFNATSAKSDDIHPQKQHVEDLWCQANSGVANADLLTIREAHLQKENEPVHKFVPRIGNSSRTAYFQLNSTSVTAAGRYRCTLVVEQPIPQGHVWGYIFVYSRPVFHSNTSRGYEFVNDDRFHIRSKTVKATDGDTVVLDCPAVAYPLPSIRWLRDNSSSAIESNERISLLAGNRNLRIEKVGSEDEGTYSCIASNVLPSNSGNVSYSSRLDQGLRVTGSYRWVYPLILIIIMLVLVLAIIYGCTAFNRYQAYNVEKRERRSGRHNNSSKMSATFDTEQKMPILQ